MHLRLCTLVVNRLIYYFYFDKKCAYNIIVFILFTEHYVCLVLLYNI